MCMIFDYVEFIGMLKSLNYTNLFLVFCFFIILWRSHVQKLVFVATIEIKKSKFSILMQYVEEVLLEIQEIALNNTGKLLKKKTALCHCDYAKNAKNMNFLVYSLSLNNALFLDLKGRVKLKLQENGFHDKTGKELENYIEETALLLLHTNRNSVKQRIDLIVDELKGKDQKRFPDSLAITAYRKVVYKAIEKIGRAHV